MYFSRKRHKKQKTPARGLKPKVAVGTADHGRFGHSPILPVSTRPFVAFLGLGFRFEFLYTKSKLPAMYTGSGHDQTKNRPIDLPVALPAKILLKLSGEEF